MGEIVFILRFLIKWGVAGKSGLRSSLASFAPSNILKLRKAPYCTKCWQFKHIFIVTGDHLPLFAPAYLSVSKDRGKEGISAPPPCILGLVWVRLPILPRSYLPYSKGFMKFGWLEPPNKWLTFIIFIGQIGLRPLGLPFSKLIIGKSQVFSTRSYLYLHKHTQIRFPRS